MRIKKNSKVNSFETKQRIALLNFMKSLGQSKCLVTLTITKTKNAIRGGGRTPQKTLKTGTVGDTGKYGSHGLRKTSQKNTLSFR